MTTDLTVDTWGSYAHSLTNQEATIIAEQRADSGVALSVNGTPLTLAYSQGPVKSLTVAPTTLYLGHVSDGTLQINGTIAKVICSKTIKGQHG